MELDSLDKSILYSLNEDGRSSLKSIAKKCHTSSEVVRYRIDRFRKEGVIKKFMALINFSELGYIGHGVFCSFRGEDEKQSALKILSEHSRIYWLAEFGGSFDLAFALLSKDTYEFYSMLNSLKEKLPMLYNWEVAIRIQLNEFPRTYLAEQKRNANPPYFGRKLSQRILDEADFSILKSISQHARIELSELAEKCHLAPSTAAFRLKRLESESVIQGYSPQIACQKFGCQSYQLFLSVENLGKERREAIYRFASSNPNIIFLIETLGKWNFELIYEVKDQRELQKQMALLRERFPELKMETGIIFDHYVKYDQFPL